MKQRTNKLSVAIVGAGSLASALAIALREAGFEIHGVYARGRAASLARGRRLAKRVASRVRRLGADPVEADLLWLCVPDAALADCAATLAGCEISARVALHSSGALSSQVLAPLAKLGCAIASAHPMMTFVGSSRPSLHGVWFGMEGDKRAVRTATSVIRALGANVLNISTADKALYHAWGMFSSPLLIATLAAGESVAALAGIDRRLARQAMSPIIEQTVANYLKFGAARALSGPLQRGDVETVQAHIDALRRSPELSDAYSALVRIALRRLPVKNSEGIKRAVHTTDTKQSRRAQRPSSRSVPPRLLG